MAKCYKCGQDEESELVDAILQGSVIKICKICSENENIPIIRKPTTGQLKDSEKRETVGDKLKKVSKSKENENVEEIGSGKASTLNKIREREKEKRKISENRGKSLNLADNYHWHISKARRDKRLSRRQLASEIGESEAALKMVENKELPEEALVLIRKLEQYLGVELREETEEEKKKRVEEVERRKKIRASMKELGVEKGEKKGEKKEKAKLKDEKGEIKIDRDVAKNLTIDDLRNMRKEMKLEKKDNNEEVKGEEKEDAENLIEQVEKDKRKREEERVMRARELQKEQLEGYEDTNQSSEKSEESENDDFEKGEKERKEENDDDEGMLGEVELE